MIAPPSHRLPDEAQVQVLFAEARRRRRRRRLAAGVVSLVLAGPAVALSIGAWSHQPRRGPAHAAHPPAAVQRVPGFSLPPATVAWVDYSGRLHIGAVATRAQHVAGTIPAWAGAGWLVQDGGRIYGAGINQNAASVREYDIATGKVRYLAPGNSVFTSADGRHLYIVRTDTRLIELPVGGTGAARQLALPAGWYMSGLLDNWSVAGGIVVYSSAADPSRSPVTLAVWNPAAGSVRIIGRDRDIIDAYTPPGGRYSLIAWAPARCMSGNCPIEITSTATRVTVTARSPLPYGFAGGAAFSPDGTRLAVFERTASISSSCCANNSVLAIVNTRTGAVRAVRAARLVTEEDAGWVLWLPGGRRLLAGALSYSYAVDTTTYAARPFFFFPQTADGPDADHNIMDTPDINFSAVLLPSAAARPAASAAPGSAALVRDRAVRR